MHRHTLASLLVFVLAVTLALAAWADGIPRCRTCGIDYAAGSTYCGACGGKLVLVLAAESCPRCLVPHAPDVRVCGACGYEFGSAPVVKCECGHANDPYATFCRWCGKGVPRIALPAAAVVPAAAQPQALRQWAARALGASSQYGTRLWTADMLVGPPDCQVEGKDGRVWCPGAADGGAEWAIVEYAVPVAPTQVRVHESLNPGCVARLEGQTTTGQWVRLWEGQDPATPENKILDIAFKGSRPPIARLRLILDTARVPGWNEIDAVELIGVAAGAGAAPPGAPEAALPPHDVRVGSPATGAIAVRPDSLLTYQVARGASAGALAARIHYVSANAVAFAWSLQGGPAAYGYRRLPLPVLEKSYGFTLSFPDEEAGTRADASALWVSRRVYWDLAEKYASRLLLDGVGAVELTLERRGDFQATVNGKNYRVPALWVKDAGSRGRLVLLDDGEGPLVLEAVWGEARLTLVSAEGVQVDWPRLQAPRAPYPPLPPVVPPYVPPTAPPTAPPAYAPGPVRTPDAVYLEWKQAIQLQDGGRLLACYTASERARIEADPLGVQGVFARYGDAVRDEGKLKIRGRSETNGIIEWEMEIRIQELLWTRKVKEVFQFVPEDGGYRMQIRARY
ncbi:MAG: zinc ribbon domain-containing protein [Planctomycetes bacterium]|nr:zinc ribbon domain-containing protein [Planctomycetota bacterium]